MNSLLRARLEDLYIERDAVNRMIDIQVTELYNCDYKQEIVNLIQEDIDLTEKELNDSSYDYEDQELENERDCLCLSLGTSRYC